MSSVSAAEASVHSSEQVCTSQIPFEGFRSFTDASAVVSLSVQKSPTQQGQSVCLSQFISARAPSDLTHVFRPGPTLFAKKQEATLQVLAGEHIRICAEGNPLEIGINSTQALLSCVGHTCTVYAAAPWAKKCQYWKKQPKLCSALVHLKV